MSSLLGGFVLLWGVSLQVAGCSGKAEQDPPVQSNAGASAMAGSAGQSDGCVGSPPQCVGGVVAGPCGDTFSAAKCVSGKYQCAAGQIKTDECGCFNSPPRCYAGKAGGACSGTALVPDCGHGSWTCPSGSIPELDCGCVLSGDAEFAGAGGAADSSCP